MSGYVYFILCEPMGAVKIGFTKSSPTARLASLQTGNPARLKLYVYVPATIEEERRLHEAFAPLHIQGEWFRLEAKLQDFIWYLRDEGTASPRHVFESALHDVLMQGLWYPHGPYSEDDYLATGRWEPFRKLLWEEFGPWDDEG